MAKPPGGTLSPTATELIEMHEVYRRGGHARQIAPHIVYPEPTCPYPGCEEPMQAIDFRLEDHGRDVHDRLVRSWWNDSGFVGRCPRCNGWIHFSIKGKRTIDADEASYFPQLPDDWYTNATIL